MMKWGMGKMHAFEDEETDDHEDEERDGQEATLTVNETASHAE